MADGDHYSKTPRLAVVDQVGKFLSGLRRQEEIEEKIYMCSLPPSLPLSHPTSEI
jgi:hypothetical protein